MSRTAGPAGRGRTHKPNWTEPLSERLAASSTRAFAMQSSPATARRGQTLREGRPKSSHLPPVRPAVPGNLWLAQALNHMTAQAASWEQGGLEYSSRPRPSRHKPWWALCANLRNGPVCRTPKRAARMNLQLSSWSPADGGDRHPASFLRPRPPRSLSPALCRPAPDTHNPQDALGPQGRFHVPRG